ncbi:hypothetical protein EfmAA290_11100 [Enterococcus faecium]|nr:hypothetical protein EfmAA290_11100 [Enterococcus faecium]
MQEEIVGLQTDKPLKQAFMPFGGINMANNALKSNGYTPNDELTHIFTDWRKTHNQGVFDAYTAEMRAARKNKIITGLPDAYGRGRIIGDYRRVALYGIDYLMEQKKKDHDMTGYHTMSEEVIRLREEITEQYACPDDLWFYDLFRNYDISKPAANAKEAVQWLYFGYLAAIKSQNGAAMSIGRISAFLDIYIQRDLDNGVITEKEAQELIDHLVMKLRYFGNTSTQSFTYVNGNKRAMIWSSSNLNNLFTELGTKLSLFYPGTWIATLVPSPEPNLTVLYSEHLPEGFRTYASRIAIESSSIQLG